jgi:hypothetical protein
MKLTAPQTKALKMLSLGVSINLRQIFTKTTVNALLGAGLISEVEERGNRRAHAITAAGAERIAASILSARQKLVASRPRPGARGLVRNPTGRNAATVALEKGEN